MTGTTNTQSASRVEATFPGNLTATPLTMSSLEIAGLMGKRHQDVLRDIRRMAQAIEIPNFAQLCAKLSAGQQGRPMEVINLPKRETLILVSGYRADMRARIIDRWLQLEAALAGPDVSHETLDRVFGISRMLAHKITEIEKLLPTIKQEAVDAALAADPRRAVMDYVSVRQLLADAKAHKKGRNRINRKVGRELCDRIAATAGVSRKPCPHSGVWLYPRDFAALYMAERGLALVREHNDRVMGQGVVRLVGKAEGQEHRKPL